MIGFISGFIKALYPWFCTKTVGHISYLIIEPDYRSKGIGGLLEKGALSWFKSKNISYVEVYTDEINSPGVAAWSSYGYLPFKKFLRKKI
jgi:GNAT superfamily N-acetyltransferase